MNCGNNAYGTVQGACERGPSNPGGMCTVHIYEDGFQINQGSGIASPQDAGKLVLSNIRMRQTPVEVDGALVPSTGHAGLILVRFQQLWLQNVFLEGSRLSPRARGLDVDAGVAVYMEGTVSLPCTRVQARPAALPIMKQEYR